MDVTSGDVGPKTRITCTTRIQTCSRVHPNDGMPPPTHPAEQVVVVGDVYTRWLARHLTMAPHWHNALAYVACVYARVHVQNVEAWGTEQGDTVWTTLCSTEEDPSKEVNRVWVVNSSGTIYNPASHLCTDSGSTVSCCLCVARARARSLSRYLSLAGSFAAPLLLVPVLSISRSLSP